MFYVPADTGSNKSLKGEEITGETVEKIIEELNETSGKIVVELKGQGVWMVIKDDGGVWFFKGRGEVFEKVKELLF